MELSKLKDNVKPHPFEKITRQENFRCTCPVGKMSPTCYRCNSIESMFEEFERTPIASASVAQVYRAKLQGRDVAVKLLRPNVKKQIETDLALLSWVLPVVARLTGISKSLDVEGFLSELSSGLALLDFGATGVIDPELKSLTFGLFYAVYLKDTEEALRSLLKIAHAHPSEVDVHALYAELDELVAKFHMNVHESSQAENFARIALKYGLSFPPQLTLLERAILLVQG